ncbi:phosphoribosylaminoimidazolesuccinocarboxamide synthase [Periweissella ghanensis]|uniref:Phosphoribosylaminoimidazole-succinocarboxamide synthase n=1 Tax=Periweissella ghanensis TaxID=467997 RepID=A0ABM8ZE22_9LACO|nr:phosphoribosylaminoimidazolesuccinocarboxamide synthase [Periweissella ghanensis]MCM0600022.1 phosphoribosylaminoimidazolesuccinocarboxamide synthase [Periweissella ghanensis]CAH0418922.1 Phosphoribosylaminoimidazole-succinocarboxamide synthase [Periweissella ghanensis]
MQKGPLLYTGKAKNVFGTDTPEVLWVEYTNQATALNGKRKEQIANKGQLNSAISDLLFKYLTKQGIVNHYLEQLSPTVQLVKQVKILPIEVVVRNYAAGHFVTKYNAPKMKHLVPNVHEFYFKDDALDDPFMNDEQITALEIATEAELVTLRGQADIVNVLLSNVFKQIGITLIDFKLEFGYTTDHQLILADELSPDNMRLIDDATGHSLDKDVFRNNLGDVTVGYQTVLDRLTTLFTEK